jgi:hypothetical protein
MWFYVQMALPLLTIGFAAAICSTVTSFIVGHAQPHPVRLWRAYRKPRQGEISLRSRS